MRSVLRIVTCAATLLAAPCAFAQPESPNAEEPAEPAAGEATDSEPPEQPADEAPEDDTAPEDDAAIAPKPDGSGAQPQPPAATQPAAPTYPPYGPQQGYSQPPPAGGYHQQPQYHQQPPPQPGYYGYPPGYGTEPPPPPRRRRGKHLHDGFYLRLGLAAGPIAMNVDGDAFADEAKVDAGGIGLEVALGGTPANGLVLGGMLFGAGFSEPEVERDGESTTLGDASFDLSVLAFFVNYYFDPTSGLHLQGLLGVSVGALTFDDDELSSEGDENATGGVAGIGIGWEGFVADEWSLGGMLRVISGSLTSKDGLFARDLSSDNAGSRGFGEERINYLFPHVLFVATYH